MSDSGPATADLVNRVIRGDEQALAALFHQHRPRLWRLVSFRLHPRLRGRVDPDDVLQEAYMNARDRVDHFLHDASRSVFIWFRFIVLQTLINIHRRHLDSQKRDARRETTGRGVWDAQSTSTSLAFHLMGKLTSPSSAAVRAEATEQLDAALETMNDMDREVLALRHYEELTNVETALALEISEQAASLRYVRALKRLKQILAAFQGTPPEPRS